MDHDDDGETSYNTFVDDVAFEPTYPQALLTAAGRNVATTRVIIFELYSPTYTPTVGLYINVRYGQTFRRTDGRLTIAIPS